MSGVRSIPPHVAEAVAEARLYCHALRCALQAYNAVEKLIALSVHTDTPELLPEREEIISLLELMSEESQRRRDEAAAAVERIREAAAAH
jgi:hypothetical protein